MMYKQLVYVEAGILNDQNTRLILNNLNKPKVITINHYKDVFNQSGTQWRVQKAAQKIILAQRTDNFYYKGSDITPAFGFDNFYYNTLALNCIYDCDYCYLQGMFNGAHLVLFVNNNSFISKTAELVNSEKKPVYMALSYDTDLLAIEHFYPYCKEWILFCATMPNLFVEIRTKSANTTALKKLTPNNNIILAWTLSPQTVIKRFEPRTPSMNARIKAIGQAIAMGWRVRICIDPILNFSGWKEAYSHMIDLLNLQINLNHADSYSLGVFRMNKLFLKRIQTTRDNSPLLFDNYETINDTATYQTNLKYKLINEIKTNLIKRGVTKEIAVL